MELKERPVVTQLQVVKERIRVIRKILDQSDRLKQWRPPPENYTSNKERCENEDDDDETIYQAQKNLRELIDTLNSGKEDKYANSNEYNNDYSDDDEYNDNYSNEEYQQCESKRKKKRQLATISVQNPALRQRMSKSLNRSKKKSAKKHNNDYNERSPIESKNKRIFGLNKRKDHRFEFDSNSKEAFEKEYSEYSSSYFYCPVCSHKIHKHSKSSRECNLHQQKKRRNASTSRKVDDHRHFKYLPESTESYSLYGTYTNYDDITNYDDYTKYDKYSVNDKKHEKRSTKNHKKDESISTYYTSTSTLLNRYCSSPTVSLDSTYDLSVDDADDLDDIDLYDFSDEEDDIDVEKILKNLEKRRVHLSSINDISISPLTRASRIANERFTKRSQKEKQSCSNNSNSLKPRYKFDDSISSSCSVLSDLLDEMSEEEKKFNGDREIAQPRKSKHNSQKQELNNQKQRKNKQTKKTTSNSNLSNDAVASLVNTEDNIEYKSLDNKELIHILQNPSTKNSSNISPIKKVQHTVKFLLEEEEEDAQNNTKSSSSQNNIKNNSKPISMVVNINEEEELSEDVFLNSNILVNSNQKIDAEEESMLELSSDNSNDDVIFMQKFNQKDYSIEEEMNDVKHEKDLNQIISSLTKSKEEEESLFELTNKSDQNVTPKKHTTSSSLYNDVDDIDIDIEEEEEVVSNHDSQSKTKSNKASEEESLSIEMPQFIEEEEEEDDEVVMINHLNDEEDENEDKNEKINYSKGEEEDFEEEDDLSGKFNFENDNLSNDEDDDEIENQIQNKNENNQDLDQKSQHKLSDFVESGSVNIADDDFL